MKTKLEAQQSLKRLKPFIGPAQRRAVQDLFRGEEAQYFFDKICAIDTLITAMPKSYEQDGKGDQAIVTLHYFAGGSANWWITEKDMGVGQADLTQHQAFGLANLHGGPDSHEAELGYISIVEILQSGAELNFHFQPRTIAELRTP